MSAIEIPTPEETMDRKIKRAEDFLAEYGFVRGQNYQADLEALTLATRVMVELEIRKTLDDEHAAIERHCSRVCERGCRGWDLKSPHCGCKTHWIELVIKRSFPMVDWEVICICCCDCVSKGGNLCKGCGSRLCSRCQREHEEDGC